MEATEKTLISAIAIALVAFIAGGDSGEVAITIVLR